MPQIRVLLVDDSEDFLAETAAYVERLPGFEVVGRATSGAEAVAFCERTPVELVLMDLAMPVMDGLQATTRIKSRAPAPAVVIVTLHDGVEYRQAARAAGADGLVSKPDLVVGLPPLLEEMRNGGLLP